MTALTLILALVVGTWNGKWFPSGRAEHRAAPGVEAQTMARAGRMLRTGLLQIDPTGTEDVVLCLNEIRNPKVAEELVRAIGREGLRVASVTGYRRRDRFDQQQDVILTTLPVVQKKWGLWKKRGEVRPPRGYAHALVELAPSVTAAVYAVHLKSEYGATTEALREENRRKRQSALEQLAALESAGRWPRHRPAILAGDFNADKYQGSPSAGEGFGALESVGFRTPLDGVPSGRRTTYPSRRYGDATLDYVFTRGLKVLGQPLVLPNEGLSDHRAVFVRVSPREG